MQVKAINSILQSKFNNLITKPGTYELQVSGVFYNEKLDRLNVNFKAVTPYIKGEIKKMLAPFKSVITGDQEVELDLNHSDAQPIKYALGMGLYTMVRATDFIPEARDFVKVRVDEIENKDGVKILVVSSITPVALTKATKASVNSLFEEEEEIILEQN